MFINVFMHNYIMNIPYMIRRLTFSFELKGFFTKIDYFIKELISLSTRISPVGPQKVIWNGPKGNIVLNFYDSLVCWRDEILDQHLYDIELKSKTPTILDIGANQGFFTLWMKYNYPGAIIHAFEPCKQSANMIISNVVDNNFQDVFIHNVGISDKNKIAYLNHIGGGAGLGDTVVNNSSMGNEKITLINLDPLLKRFKNFDLIKIDIEGSEFPVLDNCSF